MPDEIRNHVRRLRFEQGEVTQEELAQRAGVTRQTIIALEAGRYNPSLLLAFRIARALNTPLERVFEHQPAKPLRLK
jgi:putative transcriptional regulator